MGYEMIRICACLVAKGNISYFYFMLIIPALYIKNGKLAAFNPGEYEHLQYLSQDPYELIDKLGEHDIQRIYLLDLDASHPNDENNKGLIGSLANVAIPDLEVGGGLSDINYLKSLQYAGVDHFVIGTSAHLNPSLVETIAEAKHIKNERIKIAFDLIDGKLTALGFTEEVEESLEERIAYFQGLGLTHFHVTNIHTDKEEDGPDLDFYRKLVESFPEAHFSASGHIHTFEDIDQLKEIGIEAVLVGNQIYREPGILAAVAAYNKAEGN